MNVQQNSSNGTGRHEKLSLGKRMRDEDLSSGGRCHRGLGRGSGQARGSGRGRGIISVDGERHSGAGIAHDMGSIEDSASGGRSCRGLGRGSGRARESGRGRCIASVGGERHRGAGRAGRAHDMGSIEDSASGGRSYRGLGRGSGRARESGRGMAFVGGERHSGAGRAHYMGSIEDSASCGRSYRGLGRGSGRARESGRGMASVGGERHSGALRAHGRGSIRQRRLVPDVNIGNHHNNLTAAVSTEPSSIANDPDSRTAAATNQHNNITILPWPNPQSHYIPVEEEERLLPVLIHWGRSERGMLKDHPPFRLQKIQNMLDRCPGKGNHSNSSDRPSSTASNTQRMSLAQSLSLRRHHLKLLNPNLSMSTLRLGREEDIRDAAREFELCVEAYLRSHRVHFLTEHAQKSMFLESVNGDLATSRNVKQPPSPDFMIKKGHSVTLSFSSGCQNSTGVSCPISINWIEVKMFYGANSIPCGTPNAVGCILPKVQKYVSLYGTGAIVFMYGCGSRLAEQLLDGGVVALDSRCLDLKRVENHQKKWCADSWGNILF